MNTVIEVIKLFYAQLSMKFIMLINVKMPTIVGILTFMSMINTSEKGSAVAQWKSAGLKTEGLRGPASHCVVSLSKTH